jgi:alkylation response protein AidB-like acyl-CoA dehydrogenase
VTEDPAALGENGAVDTPTFSLSDEQRQFRQTMRQFAEERILPHAAQVDRDAVFPWESFAACCELELPSLGIPEAYGGAGADMVTQAIVAEELARVCASTSLTILISKLGMLPVMNWGSEELKRKYLPQWRPAACKRATASLRQTPGATWPPCAPAPCVTARTTS